MVRMRSSNGVLGREEVVREAPRLDLDDRDGGVLGRHAQRERDTDDEHRARDDEREESAPTERREQVLQGVGPFHCFLPHRSEKVQPSRRPNVVRGFAAGSSSPVSTESASIRAKCAAANAIRTLPDEECRLARDEVARHRVVPDPIQAAPRVLPARSPPGAPDAAVSRSSKRRANLRENPASVQSLRPGRAVFPRPRPWASIARMSQPRLAPNSSIPASGTTTASPLLSQSAGPAHAFA